MIEEKIFIPGPVGQLEAAVYVPVTTEVIAIMCHPHSLMGGTMNNKVVTTIVRAWQQKGLTTLRFNFRSVEQSAGKFDEGEGEQQDLAAVIAWAKQQYGDKPLILGGFSFGAYVALKFCQHYLPTQLVLVAPPAQYAGFNELNIPATASYLIVAGEDEVVPTPDILAWAAHQPFKEILNVEGASHFFHGKLLAIKDFILSI